jgi:anti-sigma-K factor RskA
MIDDRLHDLAGAYALGALDAADRVAFEQHLRECSACASEVRSLQPVVDGLAQVLPLVDPPAALRERVLASIQPGAPKLARGATIAVPPKLAERRTDPASPKLAERTRTASVGGWLAAAASLVLAVGLGIYVWQLRDRLTEVERRLDEATARAAASETQVAALQRASLDVRTTALVIGAPDLLRVDLVGQGGSAAKARAFWSRAHGLVFTAVDLPALPPGKVYQLWVVGPQAPVSAGIFEPDAAGRATTIVEAGRQFPEPAAFAVTLEPAGGVPQPTGDKVLVGLAGL